MLGPCATLGRKQPRRGGTLAGVQLVPGSSNSVSGLHRSHFVIFPDIGDAFSRKLPIKADNLPNTGSVCACESYGLYMQARRNRIVTMPHHTTGWLCDRKGKAQHAQSKRRPHTAEEDEVMTELVADTLRQSKFSFGRAKLV